MVHRYIYSRYSPVFDTLYQLYHSLPSSTLYSSSSLYLKLQPELLLKVVTGLLRRLDPIPYLVKKQNAAVTRTTFYRVAGLKSLANHRLRSYHTHKVWCGGADEGLIEYGKAQEWFTDYFNSELVMVCKGGHLRDTMRGGSRLSL